MKRTQTASETLRYLPFYDLMQLLAQESIIGQHHSTFPSEHVIIIHRKRDIRTSECKWGDILPCNYTTFTERGTFHIYRMIPTQILLNSYIEGEESILCTDQTRQSYCGTNGNVRLWKISYLQYVKNKTPVSSNTLARPVCSELTATQTWAFK